MSYEACPFANSSCKYFSLPPKVSGEDNGCYADVHHHWWPSPDFRTKTEKEFRNLEIYKELACRALHDEVHMAPPPDKPCASEMRSIIEEQRSVSHGGPTNH